MRRYEAAGEGGTSGGSARGGQAQQMKGFSELMAHHGLLYIWLGADEWALPAVLACLIVAAVAIANGKVVYVR